MNVRNKSCIVYANLKWSYTLSNGLQMGADDCARPHINTDKLGQFRISGRAPVRG